MGCCYRGYLYSRKLAIFSNLTFNRSFCLFFLLSSVYLGVYAFRLPDSNDENGIWAGYEDADTVGNKAAYAKAKGLGGVAIIDLTLDDFRGLCSGDKFPLLRAAKFRL